MTLIIAHAMPTMPNTIFSSGEKVVKNIPERLSLIHILNNVTIESLEWAAYLSETQQDNRYDITVLTWSNVTGDGT